MTTNAAETPDSWDILIVDDDDAIHAITELSLAGFEFAGKGLRFFHAFSGDACIDLLRQHPSISVVLMDLVMETETAGLEAIDQIRHELGLWDTRIVLRTAQAGVAPVHEVVQKYDVNDYVDKRNLSPQKLFAMIYTSLTLYTKIRGLRQANSELHGLGKASARLFLQTSSTALAGEINAELLSMYCEQTHAIAGDGNQADIVDVTASVVWALDEETPQVLSHRSRAPTTDTVALDPVALNRIKNASLGSIVMSSKSLLARSAGARGGLAIYVQADKPLNHPGQSALDLFMSNASGAMDNALSQEQPAGAEALDSAASAPETSPRVARIGRLCGLIGRLIGLSAHDVSVLQDAVALYDANRPSMPPRVHAKSSTPNQPANRPDQLAVDAAAIIAAQHHERWDGLGYPDKLNQHAIHRFGRIVTFADVFDALLINRKVSDAVKVADILTFFKNERGRQFDPEIVDLLLEHTSEFTQIATAYDAVS